MPRELKTKPREFKKLKTPKSRNLPIQNLKMLRKRKKKRKRKIRKKKRKRRRRMIKNRPLNKNWMPKRKNPIKNLKMD